MRQLYIFAHLFGLVLWMGGGFCAMSIGFAMRGSAREDLGVMARLQGRIQRALILPGSLMAVISGLLLTLQLYGTAASAAGFPLAMMVMQGAGLLAAVLVFTVNLPTVTRLSRLDPRGEHAPLFAALQNRATISGLLTGGLAMTALIAGALLR